MQTDTFVFRRMFCTYSARGLLTIQRYVPSHSYQTGTW